MNKKIDVDIVMPVYNESEGIASVIQALYREIHPRLHTRFIISEDGSTDNTKEILWRVRRRIPMTLLTNTKRIGYSQGMLRGLRVVKAPFVLCVDSDGQYDPKDFWKLWNARMDSDVVIGYRKKRNDSFVRVVMSRMFYYCFRFLFPRDVHDPSCSYILFRKEVMQQLVPILGLTNEGFWWEFMARVKQHGFVVQERIIRHSMRKKGATKIYSFIHIPAIAVRHIVAMTRVAFGR